MHFRTDSLAAYSHSGQDVVRMLHRDRDMGGENLFSDDEYRRMWGFSSRPPKNEKPMEMMPNE